MLGLFSLFFDERVRHGLCWAALWWIVARYLRTGNERLWLLFGLVAGVGLENKISVLFLGFGVVCGLLIAGPRPPSAALALDWRRGCGRRCSCRTWPGRVQTGGRTWSSSATRPSRRTSRYRRWPSWARKCASTLPGAACLDRRPRLPARSPAARPYRAIGWAYLAVLAVMLIDERQAVLPDPGLHRLFAAGGVALERLGAGRGAARGVGTAGLAFLIVSGIAVAPRSRRRCCRRTPSSRTPRDSGCTPASEERRRRGGSRSTSPTCTAGPNWRGDRARLPGASASRSRPRLRLRAELRRGGRDRPLRPALRPAPAISGHNSYFPVGPGHVHRRSADRA